MAKFRRGCARFLMPQASRQGPAAALLAATLLAAGGGLAPWAGAGPAMAQPAAPRPAEATPPVARGAQQPLERARAAQARGDLRAAQIEFRNAVRADQNSAFLRATLAQASLDLNDGDTAEKEARAAMERGFDPVAGTALLLRAYLVQQRYAPLLRDFPIPADPARAAVGGQIAAARAQALLAQGDRAAAREAAEQAVRLAPGAAAPHLAAASVAAAEGNRAAVEASVERALAIEPDGPEPIMRKAALLAETNRGEEAIALLGRLIERAPGNPGARTMRGELLMRAGNDARARDDVEAALRSAPGSVAAIYVRALLMMRAQDWRGADENLQRLGSVLPSIPEGLFVQAVVKRALNQTAQALDSAQRYAARRPEDPRGAKLLATMEMEANQPANAAAVLQRLADRGAADLEALDMLARVQLASGRPRAAVTALEKAIEMAPERAELRARLAAAQLAVGDSAGSAASAREALRLAPDQGGARELLVIAALGRGDLQTAEAELARLDPQARQGEVALLAAASLQAARLDLAGAKAGFEEVLRRNEASAGARLGLARLALRQGAQDEAIRRWGEVLRRDATNTEALGGLAGVASSRGPLAPQALAALEAAQVASPAELAPAITLANVLIRTGEGARAAALLDTEALRNATGPGGVRRGGAVQLVRAEALAAAGQWEAAENASRAALAEDADSSLARRQLALLLARRGDRRAAEELVQAGLRLRPGDGLLQQTLIGLIREGRGVAAALAAAEALEGQRESWPAVATLRGDLLLADRRPAEAAQAFAASLARVPNVALLLRQSGALRAAGDAAQARSVLEDWLRREPRNVPVLNALSQIDLQQGLNAEAERRLAIVVEESPADPVALNNLAWLMAERGGTAALPRARGLAERAYLLLPAADSADTLGWILVRSGEPARGVPLLREAVATRQAAAAAAPAGTPPSAGEAAMTYRLAFALNAAGERQEALRVIEPLLASGATFPERAEAERLRAALQAAAR